MGEYFRVEWLAGVAYIVECSERTGWEQKANRMTPEQFREYDKFDNKQFEEHKLFLKKMTGNTK